MEGENKQLLYLLKFMDDYIENLIYDVLSDSPQDPHYSAVTACNLIKCYIKVMNENNREINYCDIKGYFENHSFTKQEYERFLESAQKETEYYIGEIF